MEDVSGTAGGLVVENMPDKKRYRAGQEIDYSGLVLVYDGEVVTDKCKLDVKEGAVWRADDKKVVVTATYRADGEKHTATFTLKRELPWALLLIALALLLGVALFFSRQPHDEVGSYIYPKGDMTDEEAQALVNEQAEKSRIAVSINTAPEIRSDGLLHVNFAVAPDNNGLSERLEVEQDEKIVYSSQVIEPGHIVKWGESRGARVGAATATVYAVNSDGADTGNPVSAEIEIVAAEGGE